MAKRDRIPETWPPLVNDVLAARYLDMSVSQFRTLVDAGRLPKGREVFGSSMVRWRRAELDAAIDLDFGLPANKAGLLAAADGTEWMEAINAN